jgi:hypothetical protein
MRFTGVIVVAACLSASALAQSQPTPRDSDYAHFRELAGGAAASEKQADALAELVRVNTYRCDSITTATRWVWSEGWTIKCNNLRYAYDVEDKGGHWTVTVR